jgi:hypothetical protein
MRSPPSDPFEPVPLTIDYVDSAAGSQKTTKAIRQAALAAMRGQKTIFAMPTEALIREWASTIRREHPAVAVHIITSEAIARRTSVAEAICRHIAAGHNSGHILFITHEGLVRVTDWPSRASDYHLIIDEVLDVILSRKPLRYRFSHFQLLWFLDIAAMPARIPGGGRRSAEGADGEWTARDQEEFERGVGRLKVFQRLMDPIYHAAAGEAEMAERLAPPLLQELQALQARKQAAEQDGRAQTSAAPYYRIVPKPDLDSPNNPYWQTELRARSTEDDAVFETFEPVPRWLTQGAPLFTDMARWNRMVGLGLSPGQRRPYDAGLITISGFRRPDFLTAFERVTIMSALFAHTMLYAVWSKLGVNFTPSTEIRMSGQTSPLLRRRLRLYWLTEHGWSKKARDKAGGIGEILRLIHRANVIDEQKPVCVVVNKDDGSDADQAVVKEVFANGLVMPHNTRGQNRWRTNDQLIYCAALNSFTPDIRWLEQVFGIDTRDQRIARLGQEIYQTAMRLSLRDPTSQADVAVVVMDKDVAEWLVQWFEPEDQVEVAEIDSSGVIHPRGRPGRPTIGDGPMSAAERQRRSRAQRRVTPPPTG